MNDLKIAAQALEWLKNLQKKNGIALIHAECKPNVRASEINSLERKRNILDYLSELTAAQLKNGETKNADV